MVILSDADFAELEESIDAMIFKPGDNFDPWYPTEKEIRKRLGSFNKSDIMFLLWLLKPGMKLNEKQEKSRKAIQKMLYDPNILKIRFSNDGEEEEETVE